MNKLYFCVTLIATCVLSACGDKALVGQSEPQPSSKIVSWAACVKAENELQQANEVVPWATCVKEDAAKQMVTRELGKPGVLLTRALPSITSPVFVAATSETDKKINSTLNIVKQRNEGGTQVQSNLSFVTSDGYGFNEPNGTYANNSHNSNNANSTPKPKAIDLTQAEATDLHYVGMMSQEHFNIGMVKVGARLYPVHLGDKIGRGAWQIVHLDAQTMQLKIANKAVTYDK